MNLALSFCLLLGFGLPALAELDDDGDGMSDVWQRVHGIATGELHDDPDHDGCDNLQEALAGTDPTRGDDFFSLAVTPAGSSSVTLRWRSSPGRSYTPLHSTDLVSWTPGTRVPGGAGTHTETVLSMNPGETRQFWKIRVEATPGTDTDGDGLADWEEHLLNSNASASDSDGDGMPDAWEFRHHLALTVADADGNPDGDSLTNLQEYLAGLDPEAADPPVTYAAATRTLVSGGVARSYLLATPSSQGSRALPLVIVFHGDGGDPAGMRASFQLEPQANGGAIVAYVKSDGGSFEYWTVAGRNKEAALTTSLISTLAAEGKARTDRVFLAGFSGGAVTANAVAARLGRTVIRGSGILSGSLYDINGDIGNGANLPPAILIWGKNDTGGGTTYTGSGIPTRDWYLGVFQCQAATLPASPSPCVIYPGTPADIRWAAIDGMGHAMWNRAGEAVWNYYVSRM